MPTSSVRSPSDFYPRPPRGGRRLRLVRQHGGADISIHALREEGDRSSLEKHLCQRDFYPRPPRGGRPRWFSEGDGCESISIHALREEGDASTMQFVPRHTISIHALREEGDFPAQRDADGRRISIHALREEGDQVNSYRVRLSSYFYPRPPRGGRQRDAARAVFCGAISIHALREEGDYDTAFSSPPFSNFYPRPPRGGRLMFTWTKTRVYIFLSTPSARRATQQFCPAHPGA